MSKSKIIRLAVRRHLFLAALILLSTAVSVITALIPPVILGRVVDRLSRAQGISLLMIFSYFGLILISGVFESGRESLLVIFGQKVTHTARSALCAKLKRLPADCFVKTQPGVTASRFVGDVDTVEELFTSGIISMFADLCKVISLFVMIFLRKERACACAGSDPAAHFYFHKGCAETHAPRTDRQPRGAGTCHGNGSRNDPQHPDDSYARL